MYTIDLIRGYKANRESTAIEAAKEIVLEAEMPVRIAFNNLPFMVIVPKGYAKNVVIEPGERLLKIDAMGNEVKYYAEPEFEDAAPLRTIADKYNWVKNAFSNNQKRVAF